MSNVLLIIPTYKYRRVYPAPLALADVSTGTAYVASALQAAGHEVHGFNANNINGYYDGPSMLRQELTCVIKDLRPDVVGIGGLCTDYPFIKDAISVIRKADSNVRIVLGGGIANHDAEFVGPLLSVDHCVRGDGEKAMVDLLALGDKAPPIVDGRIEDLDSIQFPNFNLFHPERMLDNSIYTRYLYRYPKPNPRIMPIVTARGCPFSCNFCVHRKKGQRPYRTRSITNIKFELVYMWSCYQFNILLFLDELFAVDRDRLVKVCQMIQEGKEQYGWDFKWAFQTHASANLDRASLELAKEAGCYFFGYGLESSSPEVLTSMGKKTQPIQVARACDMAHSLGMAFGGNDIFGDRVERPQTIGQTMWFFSRHLREGAHVYFGSVIAYPGSDNYDYCIAKGIIKDKRRYYEEIVFEPLRNMTRIPDLFWYPWAYLMGYLGGRFGWVRKTKQGCCPYCGVAVPSVTVPSLHQMVEPRPLRVKLWFIRQAVALAFVWWHPMFWSLLPLMGKSHEVTGCPNCGRRVAIVVKEELSNEKTMA